MTTATEKPVAEMKIRIPAPIRTWIEERAVRNRRTLNSEILIALEAVMASEKTKEDKVQ